MTDATVTIPLTKGQGVILDEADYQIVKDAKWHTLTSANGHMYAATRDGKLKTSEGGPCLMHRLLMNAPDDKWVDHINGDGLDNRRSNLRLATRNENARNRQGLQKNNSTGYKGLTFRYGRYESRIRVNGKSIHLGVHRCPIEAAVFRDIAAIECHGEFANLNFPELKEVFRHG